MKVLNHHSTHTTGAICMHCTTSTTNRQYLDIDPADILADTTRGGRVVPWASHKLASSALSVVVEDVDAAQGWRMRHCADRLTFAREDDGHLALKRASFCRIRLCPMCQWRRSLKLGGQVRAVIDHLAASRAQQGRKPYAYLLLTLTIPNCPGDRLGATLDALQAGWQRMQRRKEFKAAVQGSVRCVEITYNRTSDTYHPHIHALLAVLPSYLTGRTYLTRAKWLALWRDCMRNPTITQIDIRRTTGDAAAVAEVAKYATKSTDMLRPGEGQRNVACVATLMAACRKRRFAGWAGVMRTAHQALHLDDVEDGDLIHTSDAATDSPEAPAWSWDWYVGPRLYIAAQKGANNAISAP